MFSVFSNSRLLWRNIKEIGAVMPLLGVESRQPNADQVRCFAARKGKQAKMRAAKMEKKLQEASKPKPVPKFLLRKTKHVSIEQEHKRCTNENWLNASITDDIWLEKFCRGKPYSVSNAIAMLQEINHPTMLNDLEGFIYATVELDLRLKKKNQFMADFAGTIIYPHDFETGSRKRVIVLCENSDDQYRALEAGAAYVGGTSLVKRIYSGEIKSDDYDFVVCHPDMLKECGKLRGLLKKKYPNMRNGLLRIDVDQAVKEFIRCAEFSTTRSLVEPDFGWVDIHFGRLNMPSLELEENLKQLLKTVEEKKLPGPENSLFITRTLLWCSKSAEKFKIPHWEYLPTYPVNGVIASEDSDSEEGEKVQTKQ